MKRIYSFVLVVLALLIGSTFSFAQQDDSDVNGSDVSEKIEIYSYGQNVYVKSECTGTIVVTNIATGKQKMYQTTGSETIISVDGNGTYQVAVAACSKTKNEKVVILK